MAARKAQLISVVVPVYKNRETVGELAAQLCGVTPELELIFVNDACPVGTGDVLDRLAARYKWIRVIHHSTNLGQTAALLRGIEAASGEYIAILDADLQDPPEALPLLLAELERGDWGAVFAGRRGNYQNRSRMLTSKIFKGIVTRLADLPPDAAGFVVFTRAIRERLLRFRLRNYYVPAMIGRCGYPVTSIPVERSQRPCGESAYTEALRWRTALHRLLSAIELKHKGDSHYADTSHTNS